MLIFIELVKTLLVVLVHCCRSLIKTIFPFLISEKDISGKVALVTGSAQGIGALMVHKLSAKGANIILWDIQEEKNEALAASIRALGRKAWAFTVDVSDAAAVDQAVQNVLNTVGHVDILINNAGIVSGKALDDLSSCEIRKVMSVNAEAVMTVTKGFLPSMKA